MMGEGGVYVHVPFCRRKCLYCDFYSVGERLADWSRLVDAYLKEFNSRRKEWQDFGSVTIYIGGGTPSLMPAEEFTRLASGIVSGLTDNGGNNTRIVEFTIEVNPDDVSEEKARAWKEAGVNRVSMGVQSFNDDELKAIGRRHDAVKAEEAYAVLRRHFSNISLDLMFGLPGQTLESLIESVDRVIGLNPEHVSVYSLTYEENSALTRMRNTGKVTEAPEDLSECMFEGIRCRLESVGYELYEISNYSRPGCRSKHNSNYWRGVPYVGIGPAAHSYNGENLRRWNIPDIKKYIQGIETDPDGSDINSDTVFEMEELTEDERREEMLLTSLRTKEGLDLQEYGRRFGEASLRGLERLAFPYVTSGNLAYSSPGRTRLRLTPAGVMISDTIISSLF